MSESKSSKALEYPIRLPDGVVYWSPGSVTYPKDHAYAKASEILNRLAKRSPALRREIEKATGQFYVMLPRGNRYCPRFLKIGVLSRFFDPGL